MEDSSTTFWKNAMNYESFELRAHRFRPELRPVFFQWLGIAPGSRVLDGGCGSGVFTRYLAEGLTDGHITGFDVNARFVEYGNAQLAKRGLTDRAALEVADGYHLHYPDETFDAATNYTYIGALLDPEAGLQQMIRVTRPGGTISCVIGSNALPYAGWQGGYPFDPDGELERLSKLENYAFARLSDVGSVGRMTELALMKKLGLERIHMYSFAHLLCFSDDQYEENDRRRVALCEALEELNWLKSKYAQHAERYAEYGFSEAAYRRLVELLKVKYDYLSSHFEGDESYEWHGGFNYMVTGVKRG